MPGCPVPDVGAYRSVPGIRGIAVTCKEKCPHGLALRPTIHDSKLSPQSIVEESIVAEHASH